MDKRVIFNSVASGLLVTALLGVVAVRDTVADLVKENEQREIEVESTAEAIRELRTRQEEMMRAQTTLAQDVRVSAANQQHFAKSLEEIKVSISSLHQTLRGQK